MSDDEYNVSEGGRADSVELPGRHLRQAREARGLSVADIARTLKFSERQINALEGDDYQLLSGSTFIRGFIRSYARVLKADPEPLLAMLEAGAPPAAVEVVAPINMGDAVPQAFVKRYARQGGIVFGTLAALVAGYLWWSGFSEEEQIPPVAPPTKEVSAVSLETNSPPPVLVSSVTDDQLVVDFDDKSWIEIKDAAGKVVLTGEYPGGFHQGLSGTAPFQVWIGNAPAVRMKRGDRPIDLVPSTKEGVARLTVE